MITAKTGFILFLMIFLIGSVTGQKPLPKAKEPIPKHIPAPHMKPDSTTIMLEYTPKPASGVREFSMDQGKVQITPEQLPEFTGGEQGLNMFINEYLIYPEDAKKNNAQGIVIVRFTIEADGRVTEPVIVDDMVHFGARNEVFRLISLMPRWKPGYMEGKAVPVYYTMPISFYLK